MAFWALFVVATMPVLEVLIISLLGAFLASGYCNLLVADARKHMNKIVFVVFTPSLMFASLAQSVTLQDIISWWFMPVNIGITFLLGGILGWIIAKILKPERHLEGLIIASCSAGNLGNLLLVVVPAICKEGGSPFGDPDICSVNAFSYASFSMALGGFYIWTHTYHLIKTSGELYDEIRSLEGSSRKRLKKDLNRQVSWKQSNKDLGRQVSWKQSNEDLDGDGSQKKKPNETFDGDGDTNLLIGEEESNEQPNEQLPLFLSSMHSVDESTENQPILQIMSSGKLMSNKKVQILEKVQGFLHQIVEELLAPPTISAIAGFIFGATPWLKSLIIGASAPLRVLQDSIKLLGNGTIPCITLILGGNLTKGFRMGRLRPILIIAIIIVRYVVLPAIGVGVVKLANRVGFLSADPLYQYVLMVQYTLPPAMNIGEYSLTQPNFEKLFSCKFAYMAVFICSYNGPAQHASYLVLLSQGPDLGLSLPSVLALAQISGLNRPDHILCYKLALDVGLKQDLRPY